MFRQAVKKLKNWRGLRKSCFSNEISLSQAKSEKYNLA
jgi:hypothetical protein